MSTRGPCPLCQRNFTDTSICAECALRLTDAGHQDRLPNPQDKRPFSYELLGELRALMDLDGIWEWDGDCTRCFTTISWEGDPPERPEDAICNDCAWAELDRLRAAMKKILGSSDPMAAAIAQDAIAPMNVELSEAPKAPACERRACECPDGASLHRALPWADVSLSVEAAVARLYPSTASGTEATIIAALLAFAAAAFGVSAYENKKP